MVAVQGLAAIGADLLMVGVGCFRLSIWLPGWPCEKFMVKGGWALGKHGERLAW